jgi:hypothetical protein
MSIIPTSYIRRQIALHDAVNRAREIGDRAPTLANLLDLPAERRAATSRAVATGAQLEAWDRALSVGQPWPDVIDYRT